MEKTQLLVHSDSLIPVLWPSIVPGPDFFVFTGAAGGRGGVALFLDHDFSEMVDSLERASEREEREKKTGVLSVHSLSRSLP